MENIDLTTVAGIISLTLVIVQALKPYVPASIPTKLVAVLLGAGLTAIAYFGLHTITGSLPAIVVQVILGVLGAPGIFEIFNKSK